MTFVGRRDVYEGHEVPGRYERFVTCLKDRSLDGDKLEGNRKDVVVSDESLTQLMVLSQ